MSLIVNELSLFSRVRDVLELSSTSCISSGYQKSHLHVLGSSFSEEDSRFGHDTVAHPLVSSNFKVTFLINISKA